MDYDPWIEALGAGLLAWGGLLLGWRCSGLPGKWWLVGYVVPLLLITIMGLGRNILSLEFVPPFSWLLAGRTEFLLGGLCGAWVLATPCSRLGNPRERKFLMGFLGLFVSVACIWPFLAPAFNRSFWRNYITQIDGNEICIQGTDYSCGPAAAVTALRRFGIPAQEGELAILAHTSNAIGTPSDLLSDAIERRYASDGVRARHRRYANMEELGREPNVLTLAVIKYGFLVDHYVTVLAKTSGRILVGDPNQGLREYTASAFQEIWRGTGIEIRRTATDQRTGAKASPPRSP